MAKRKFDSKTEEVIDLTHLAEGEEPTVELPLDATPQAALAAEATSILREDYAGVPEVLAALDRIKAKPVTTLLGSLGFFARGAGVTDAFELGVDAQTFASFRSEKTPEERENDAHRWGTEESRFLSPNGVHRIYIRSSR